MKLLRQLVFVGILFLCSVIIFASARQEVIQDIISKKNELGPDKVYNCFDLHVSEEEHEVLQSLQIMTKVPFRMYGNPENKEHDIAVYLESLENSAEHAACAAKIIHRFIMESFYASGFPAVSVMMRPTQKNDKFDIPRWHYDHILSEPKDMKIKIVCALKGPGTLLSSISGPARNDFLNLKNDVRADLQQKLMNNEIDEKTFYQLGYQAAFNIEHRKKQDQLVAPYEINQSATRQGALFIIGDPLLAAIHSEPPITADRLFIAIIPDTIEEIAHLQRLETGV